MNRSLPVSRQKRFACLSFLFFSVQNEKRKPLYFGCVPSASFVFVWVYFFVGLENDVKI